MGWGGGERRGEGRGSKRRGEEGKGRGEGREGEWRGGNGWGKKGKKEWVAEVKMERGDELVGGEMWEKGGTGGEVRKAGRALEDDAKCCIILSEICSLGLWSLGVA